MPALKRCTLYIVDSMRYTVYDVETSLPVAAEATSVQCARAMGIKLSSFYKAVHVSENRGGAPGKRWHIIKHPGPKECVNVRLPRNKKYTVYDNRTDFPVIVGGNAYECCEAMGIKPDSFRSLVCRAKKGINKRWTIIEEDYTDE